jgi:hypothetical protein
MSSSRTRSASSSRLWNLNSQPRHIYGWAEILENWSNDLTMNPYVQTVVDNLREAVNPDSNLNYPLSHFLTFLNNEDEGLKWLLYECITMRWMWGNIRLDFVRDLVQRVNLNETFPAFVGSPGNTMTIGHFLRSNLTDEEREFVFGSGNGRPQASYVPPVSRRSTAASDPTARNNLSRLFEQLRAEVEQEEDADSDSDSSDSEATESLDEKPNYSSWQLRFLRKNKEGNKDDMILIRPSSSNPRLFDYTYTDKESKFRAVREGISRTLLLRTLSTALRLTAYDAEPFHGVQLLAPCMPSVLFPPQALNSGLRDLIYDSLEECCDAWPVIC